ILALKKQFSDSKNEMQVEWQSRKYLHLPLQSFSSLSIGVVAVERPSSLPMGKVTASRKLNMLHWAYLENMSNCYQDLREKTSHPSALSVAGNAILLSPELQLKTVK